VKNIRHIPFFWLYLDLLMRYPTVFVSIVLLFFLAKAPESQLLSGMFNLHETQMSYKLIKNAGTAHHKTYWGNCTVGC
jgi:hypothetical protein